MTDFSSICNILGQLYSEYAEDPGFKEFIDFNDLGLPLAYLEKENLCNATGDGEKYIAETWQLFLASLNLDDEGFESLDEVLAAADSVE
jgi:hypothetical protein